MIHADFPDGLDDPDAVYDAVVEQLLLSPPAPTITALPDGSVDYRCHVEMGAGGKLTSREEFGRAIARGDQKSLRLVSELAEPGGQAVNLASGAHALGANVTLFGHLDADAMPSFPFVTHSMGEPATVRILDFDDSALMLAEESGDLLSWTFDDLRETGADLETHFSADVVCCCNWISVPNMPSALRDLADAAVDYDADGTFILDPGDIVGSDPDELRALLEVLTRLEDVYDVVLNANGQEIRELVTVSENAPPVQQEEPENGPSIQQEEPENGPSVQQGRTDLARMQALREAADISAVVMHASEEAAAATADGVVAVPNLTIGDPVRWTGGGDRFGSGLATALGAGWSIVTALALGNAAASHYVSRTHDPDAEELASFIAAPEHRPGR